MAALSGEPGADCMTTHAETLNQYKFSVLFMTFPHFSENLAAHFEAQTSVL